MATNSEKQTSTTRRLAAIMFTDIVGYTAMMGEDETDTLKVLLENHRIQKSQIERCNGHFVKEIGDGMLAYFDTAGDAIKCSVEIQKKLAGTTSVKVRIGLHYAEIILEKNDIYGDGVNIASRIEALADPGGIYMSEEVKNALVAEGDTITMQLGSAKLKNVRRPILIHAVQGSHLPEPSIKRFQKLANPKKKLAVLPTIISFLAFISIALIAVKYLDNRAKRIEAEGSLDQIEDLVDRNWRDYAEPYYLCKQQEKIIPENPRLRELIEKTSVKSNITTDPPGASVYYKLYNKPEDEWQSLGITPLDSVQLPISVFRFKFDKEGFEPVLAAAFSYTFKDLTRMSKYEMFKGQNIHRILDSTGTIPVEMTRVPAFESPFGRIDEFLIDKYEVSNQQYKLFVDEGGYSNQTYWKELNVYLGDSIEWENAMRFFVDRSGQPGPKTWENQNYPAGEDEYPVNGISWFEANAYAEFIGKVIPTNYHWAIARGERTMLLIPQVGGSAIFTPFSNFNVEGPIPIGFYDGITSYGAYDMPGNVREWCWNLSTLGRCIRGGAWNNNPYMFYITSQASPFDRAEENGFRCALYLNEDSIPKETFDKVEVNLSPDIDVEAANQFTEEEFERLKSIYYEYDRIDLETRVVSVTENEKGWVLEKVNFKTAYDNERMDCYLFLPTNTQPPYQSVIYGHSANALYQENSDNLEDFFEYKAFLEFIVKNGRAVVFPIIKGTYGQRPDTPTNPPAGSHQKTTHLTRKIKDYRRCLDFLETRDDFNKETIAFYGMSWGPRLGTFLSAVDSRIKVNIFYAGGIEIYEETRPEVNMIYFLTQVKIPTLMINGKYDAIFPVGNITAMFKLLGTPDNDKNLVLFDSDHLAPVEGVMSETLAWLDLHFGQVDRSLEIRRL